MTTPTLPQAAQMALDAPMPEPAAWKHDCAALCTNDVELWIDACPHCGKPRTAPPAAPEPEPVAWLVEGWHDGKLIAHIPHLTLEAAKASAAVFSRHYTTTKLVPLYAAPPAAPAPAVPLQGGLDNNELLAAWQKKLPGKVPEGQELNAFAVGTEVGFEHAQRLERMDWDRVHHVLAKHGKHPGRTDDHLADVIDKALSAAPVVPLTEERLAQFSLQLPLSYEQVEKIVRHVEKAHGITGGKP